MKMENLIPKKFKIKEFMKIKTFGNFIKQCGQQRSQESEVGKEDKKKLWKNLEFGDFCGFCDFFSKNPSKIIDSNKS